MSVELKSFRTDENGKANPAFADSQENVVPMETMPDSRGNVYRVEEPPSQKEKDEDEDDMYFEDLPVGGGKFTEILKKTQDAAYGFLDTFGIFFIVGFLLALAVLDFVYLGYAFAYEFGTEESARLLWITIVFYICVAGYVFYQFPKLVKSCMGALTRVTEGCCEGSTKYSVLISWIVLVIIYAGVIAFIIWDMIWETKEYYNLVSLGGMVFYMLIYFITSFSPAHINWRAVLWGLGLQFALAIFILRTDVGFNIFEWIGNRVTHFLAHSDAGASFVFGQVFQEHFFAFSVLPVIIYFSTVISMLYYMGVMQFVVQKLGWVLQTLLGTTAGESLNAAANIFIGQSEAPLMIRPLIGHMTKSELHAVMTGGFATIAGSVLAAYISFGAPANHLISASVMSAPAALAISKLRYPETKVSKTTAEDVKKMEASPDRNIIEAASNGASMSIKLVANIAVNLIAFIALLDFVNATLTWFGDRANIRKHTHEPFTFEFICSYVLYPFAFLMGVHLDDCREVAKLIGVKTFLNEFVAYERLGFLIDNKALADEYEKNYSSYDDDVTRFWSIHKGNLKLWGIPNVTDTQYLEGSVLHHKRSEVIATYALCGFSNFGSMGVMLGALGAMAPHRKKDLSTIVFSAMLAGNVACFMTACIAGLFYEDRD